MKNISHGLIGPILSTNLVITLPADGLAPDGGRSSARTVMTTQLNAAFSCKILWIPPVPYYIGRSDDVIQNGRRDSTKYRGSTEIRHVVVIFCVKFNIVSKHKNSIDIKFAGTTICLAHRSVIMFICCIYLWQLNKALQIVIVFWEILHFAWGIFCTSREGPIKIKIKLHRRYIAKWEICYFPGRSSVQIY